jgi:hypothetical protein
MDSVRGFNAVRQYPLWDAIFGRRSRRVAAGAAFRSGTLSFDSALPPQPLSRLEEALLIAATGVTGLPYADNPYETAEGKPLLGTPCLEGSGRAAGSPDNAQSTVFFMWNDEGTYLLKRPSGPAPHADVRTMPADDLIAHAERCKVKVKDGRTDFPRAFPAYAGGNRYVSNVPGSTMFVPVTEVTRQYINGLFYVIAQEPGQRPVFVDDFNRYLPCGCERWVKSKFLNKRIPIPLSFYAKGRTEYESMLLLQNLALVAQGMGLGGWIHAAFETTILLGGYPDIGPGLGFRFEQPGKDVLRRRPYPASAPNPVGLDGVLQSYAPPYFKDTDAAIDAILEEKYGPSGLYHDGATAAPGMKPDVAAAFAREAPHVEPEVIEVVRTICRYIWKTYGRFPAHCHAIDSAGIWMQCHHLDPEFYVRYFREAYSPTQAVHAEAWHGATDATG